MSDIALQLNQKEFEYDTYSLLHAFFPDRRLVMSYSWEKKEYCRYACLISYSSDKIEIEYKEYDQTLLYKSLPMAFGRNRRDDKNTVKRLLYLLLQELTKQKLPWGTLTGIRPTKLPMQLLNEGRSERQILREMQEVYLLDETKAALCTQIVQREHRLLTSMPYQDSYSLYVGIPFCPTICLYCSFSSFPITLYKDRADAYVAALCREIKSTAALMAGKNPTTIYIGGGTPTTLTTEQMQRLFAQLNECFDLEDLYEFTVEGGRPETITRDKLLLMKQYHVTRVSVNPQTMNDETLKLIGRKHTSQDVMEACRLVREVGEFSVNMDLIVGLPQEGKPQVQHTLQQISALRPDAITVHSLAVKRAARLHIFEEAYRDFSYENSEEIMQLVAAYGSEMGMTPYYLYRQKNMKGNLENVGYAAQDHAGLYNILIMEAVQTILAVGAGASSKLVYGGGQKSERVENVKDVDHYIQRVDEMIERKRRGIDKFLSTA
ncbi:MAG: coproporphyrinogen dehydrogenase HemZ [Lachnospiraceae bacterium]